LLDSVMTLGRGPQVHVILFGVGDFETEGIYSLRALRREDNLPQDTIIAFEDDDDAERCARRPEWPLRARPRRLLGGCAAARARLRLSHAALRRSHAGSSLAVACRYSASCLEPVFNGL
jgi:hypothetical protein